jgi:hypothetical protein
MLSTTTVPHSDQKHNADILQKSFETNGRINILSRELADILTASATTTNTQERLIAFFRRERYICIQSGQGWHLPLDPSSRARACGVNIMAQALGIVASASEAQVEQKALKVVRSLFGIPSLKEAVIVPQNNPRRATLFSPQRHPHQPVRGSGPSTIAAQNGQSPVRRLSRECGLPAVVTERMSAIPPNSVKESSPEGLRLIILEKSPLEELTNALVPSPPAEAGPIHKTESSEDTSIKVCDTASQSHTPIIHNGPRETPAVAVRVSEESTGAATEATSIFATRGSQSTDSQDSLLPGLKPFFGKRAGCLPVVKEENQSKNETKRLSLHAHGNRLANRLASAFSISSPALLSHNHNSLPATPIDGPRVEYPTGILEETAGDISVRKGGGDGMGRSAQTNADQSSSILLPSGGRPGQADLDSAYFDSLGNSSMQNSRRQTIIARPALSFVIPMLNQDSTIRAGMTPGQVEINLLRMIEAERQKCIVNGTVWNHRQIDGLTWLITDVQNLVSTESE